MCVCGCNVAPREKFSGYKPPPPKWMTRAERRKELSCYYCHGSDTRERRLQSTTYNTSEFVILSSAARVLIKYRLDAETGKFLAPILVFARAQHPSRSAASCFPPRRRRPSRARKGGRKRPRRPVKDVV